MPSPVATRPNTFVGSQGSHEEAAFVDCQEAAVSRDTWMASLRASTFTVYRTGQTQLTMIVPLKRRKERTLTQTKL